MKLSIKLLCVFILNILSNSLHAQNRIDSLEKVLVNTKGPERADILNALSYEFAFSSIDKSMAYAIQGLNYSKKIDYRDGVIAGLKNTGEAYLDSYKLDSAQYYFELLIEESEESNTLNELAEGYNGLANTYERLDNYPEALTFYKKALTINDDLNNELRKAKNLKNIGIVQRKIGHFDQAMNSFIDALKITKRYQDDRGTAQLLMSIAFNYINQAEGILSLDSSALIYLKEAEGMSIVKHDLDLQLSLNNYMGLIYKNAEDHDSAIKYYQKSADISVKLGKSPAIPLQNMAVAYMSIGDYETALKMAQEVLEMKRVIGKKSSIGFTLDLFAKTYLMKGEPAKAIPYALESMEIAKSTGAAARILQPYEFLSEAYAGIKEFDKAWDIRLKYENIKDSLFNEQKNQQQAALLTLYETEKKQQTIELQQANLALSEATNSKLFYGIGGAIVLAVSLLLGFIAKSRRNNLLVKQKEEIEIRDREKDILLKEIHHRVKNNLQIISSILNIQSRHLSDAKAKSAVDEGRSRIKSMSLIHEKLYSSDELAIVNMKEYISDLSAYLFSTYKPKGNVAQNISTGDIELDIDTAIPLGLILNELISNALKYAFNESEEGQLNISLTRDENDLILEVQDNGQGLPDGWQNVKSMGMRLVNSLSDQLDGTLEVINNPGAKYSLRFKLA